MFRIALIQWDITIKMKKKKEIIKRLVELNKYWEDLNIKQIAQIFWLQTEVYDLKKEKARIDKLIDELYEIYVIKGVK